MANILSLDQASRISGYAIFKDKELIKYGKIELTDDNIDARLVKFRNEIKHLIEENNINKVYYEDIQEQNNILTFKVLAEVYGVLSELLEELQIPHESVPSVSWKSGLKIKGRARQEQKQNAQKYVIETYGIKATQDESDAICIGAYKLNTEEDYDWS